MMGLSVVAIAIAGHACAPPAEQEQTGGERMSAMEAMQQSAEEWDQAQVSGDPESLIALYVPEGGKVSPPNAPTAVGAEEMRAFFTEMLSGGSNDVVNTVVDVIESGDIVIGRGTYVWTQSEDPDNPMTEAGKWLTVERRAEDGSLQAMHNIWNTDSPPEGADPSPPIAETGVSPAEGAPCPDSPTALDQAFEEYLEQGDVASTTALHTADGLRMPPRMPAVEGHDEISRYLASRMDPYSERVLDLTDIEESVEGDIAWTTGHFMFDYTPKDGGANATGEGTYMSVAVKDADGCWRHKWVIWNSDAPPEMMGE
jgi:ketosteroid isomerase-like protein